MQHLFHRHRYMYLCCSQKSLVIVETCAPMSVRTVTWMLHWWKYWPDWLHLLTLWQHFRLEGGGSGMMSIGWGSVPTLAQVLCLDWMLEGRSCCVSLLWEFKGLQFVSAQALITHMPPAMAIIALKLVLVISPIWSWFGCFWLYHYFDCCLTTGTFD